LKPPREPVMHAPDPANAFAPLEFDATLADEAATRALALEVAGFLAPGDVVALAGDLGVGKSTFARALIRELADDPALEVPSPTFTLLQPYALPRFPVMHIDLYRVSSPDELGELGWPDLGEGAVTLIEWPERAGGGLPGNRIEIALALAPEHGPEARRLHVVAAGAIAERAQKFLTFHRFLQDAGFDNAVRTRMQGDASTRIYERLSGPSGNAILMLAPRHPDGPPVRDGQPYSRIAHLAEDVIPFVGIARALRERGLSAPALKAADLAEGWLVLEDLGNEPVAGGDPPAAIEERYAAAVDALIALHRHDLPDEIAVAPRVSYRLPSYDTDAMLIEVELLLDWYLPRAGREVSGEMRAAFVALWRTALVPVLIAPRTWVLRDYHSPNLLWLPEREGAARIGMLDFQDAVIGPAAYDVVSLLQDARVDVSEILEDSLFARYLKGRRAADRDFDLNQFITLYNLMGAQRATKILGIFARLDQRDGKPQYLRHLPRVWRHLRHSLSHPSLVELKAWYEANVPPPHV
jgi:tRNA threonylcarbamoyl adenosine modification protein YjeE